ncbi:MAG TPA: VOC family protein [Patescibacteria group bacterium]|nr:VOC family protein [Patescibacteria group bacterium]
MAHHNPVVYFEIPVVDMDRAMNFYSNVFEITFIKTVIDGYEMATFPYDGKQFGASGALAKGSVYKPSKEGIFVYFGVDSIDKTLELVIQCGGRTLYPKKSNGELGFVAEFEDTEGNRIALHEALK